MSSSTQSMGDRLKAYEPKDALMQKSWVVARLDGRAFSKFTADMNKPFDSFFTDAMIATAQYLLKKYHAVVAYTQSDEITLVFDYTESVQGEMLFAGREQKIASVLAGSASAKFTQCLMTLLPHKIPDGLDAEVPEMDCRVYCVPSVEEAANTILWRQQDCLRNSIQMLGRAHFSHNELMGVSSPEIARKLWDEKQVLWDDVDAKFRYGTTLYYKEEVEILMDGLASCTRRKQQQIQEYFPGADGHKKLVMLLTDS